MDTVLKPLGVKCSGVFLDLGISSPQFDDGSRGFRPEQDGPLDLRFDITQGVPASDFLKMVNRDELVRILHASLELPLHERGVTARQLHADAKVTDRLRCGNVIRWLLGI